MTQTRISDVVVPEVFSNYMSKNTVQTMALYQQGVMRDDADLKTKLAGGGRTFNVPFWKDLDDEESDTASDDPDSHSVPDKLSSGTDIAARQIRTKSWSSMHLSGELAGSDPMKRINERVAAYWGRQFDDIAIASVRGIYADNIANDSGDMVNSIATDSAGAETAAEWFSAEAVMDTAQTLGDAKKDLKLIVMHSVVHTRLAKNDLITFRPDSTGTQFHEMFMDWRVQVSDKCPAVAGTNRTTYWSMLFGADALGWAESPVAKPVEVDPVPSSGDGMGAEILYTRRQVAIHPYGIKWTDTTVSGEFPTNAELMLAANWDRVYAERKQLPLALLQTNG